MRSCIALSVGQSANCHMGNMEEMGDRARRQKMVVIVMFIFGLNMCSNWSILVYIYSEK